MVTTGYGDIKGTNIYERVTLILIMLVSAGLYAFNLNEISRIVSNFNYLADSYKYLILVFQFLL